MQRSLEGFEGIMRSWAITNEHSVPVRVVVHRGERPGMHYGGECKLLVADWEEFIGHRDQRMQVFELFTGSLLVEGYVQDLCQPTLEKMAEVFDMPTQELCERWAALEEERLSRKPIPLPPTKLPATPVSLLAAVAGVRPEPELVGTELEPANASRKLDDVSLLAACAAFRMNDLGGLHVRPARLIQKALEPLRGNFEFVEFLHTGNGRTARIRREETSPPLWLLLLRLEVRQNEVIAVRAVAGTSQRAIRTMAVVEGVLAKPKLERHDYWRMLGPDAYFRTYLSDFLEPAALDLRQRYRLLDKAVLERGAPPPPGTPMAQRV